MSSTEAVHVSEMRVGTTEFVLSTGALGGVVSGGVVNVTVLLGAERLPRESTVITLKL
jgi:hypothetical protein